MKEDYIDPEIIFNNFDIICLPSWAITRLKNFKFDLFINIYSFQEMEKKQSINYLSILKDKINKYVYVENAIEGHSKATKKDKFGVLEPTLMEDIENYFNKGFSKIKKEINMDNKTYKLLLKKNNSN